jgi:hypothetical protein
MQIGPTEPRESVVRDSARVNDHSERGMSMVAEYVVEFPQSPVELPNGPTDGFGGVGIEKVVIASPSVSGRV